MPRARRDAPRDHCLDAEVPGPVIFFAFLDALEANDSAVKVQGSATTNPPQKITSQYQTLECDFSLSIERLWIGARTPHRPPATPSFFCRLDDDVVYWNTSRLPGKQY